MLSVIARGLAPAAVDRVGDAVSRRTVRGDGKAAIRPVDADHRRVAAGPLHGIAHHHVIVLLPHPAPRTEVGGRHHGGQRIRRRHIDPVQRVVRRQYRGSWCAFPRTLVFRRFGDQRRDGNLADNFAACFKDKSVGVRHGADDSEVELPFFENRPRHVFAAGFENHQHALLAFGQHDLVRRHCLFAHRHQVEIEFDADPALVGHFDRRRRQPGGAHVLNGNDRIGRHQFQTGFQQQFFRERVADLHCGTFFL